MWTKGIALILFYCLNICITEGRINECGSNIFFSNCFCGKTYFDRKVTFTVNCTGNGYTTTEMLQELPEGTEKLIFTGNHIPVLESNIFGEDDLPSLNMIDFSNNGIKDIKGKAFHHVPQVEMLILNHNDISISDQTEINHHHPRVFSNFYNLEELHLTNAFADNTDEELADDLHDIFVNSNLTKLYKLHLEENEIKNFRDVSVFCDLPNLHDLHLGLNNIPRLNFDVNCIKKLRYLDLEQNNITSFSRLDLERFDRLAPPYRKENFTLEIRGNPLKCDSDIQILHDWLEKTNVIVRNKDNLECHQTKHGRTYIMTIERFLNDKSARISQALGILLVILVCIVLTLLISYFYLKRENVREKLVPLFNAMSKKVHYTTIESQDV